MSILANPLPNVASFRDPAGSIAFQEDAVLRTVRSPFDQEILQFLATPLAQQWVASGHLVASEIVEQNPTSDPALLLRHPRVSFPSYPWEWSPALWRSAATLTLDFCSELIAQGWTLKDATPLNVLFQGAEPIFVDVLSVEKRDPAKPLWLAYGQFVRSFLLPLFANRLLGWPLQGMLQRRDGYEPQDVYAALGWTQRLAQPARSLITLPVLLDRKFATSGKSGKLAQRMTQSPEVTTLILQKGLKRLRRQLEAVMPKATASAWANYTTTAVHYSTEAAAAKLEFVGSILNQAQPQRVLDVGCNTGTFSALAAEHGAEVIAIDSDLAALDRTAYAAKQRDLNILPLVVDLSRPTPAVGWEYSESFSFLERATGHFDLVMMLAVIHHLLLQAQVPLDRIASLCHGLTRRHLLIEWVPQSDPKFRELLHGRDAIYAHLDEAAFRTAFAPHFHFVKELRLTNGRVLHLLEKKC